MPPGAAPGPLPRRVLVCPQELMGSLTSNVAAWALSGGVRGALPGAEVIERAMADGGPGTVAIVARATGATLVRHAATGPLGEPVEATRWLETAIRVPGAKNQSGLVRLARERMFDARQVLGEQRRAG